MSTGQGYRYPGAGVPPQYQEQNNAYTAADQSNVMFNRNSDTEMLDMSMEPVPKRRPFDWFILSVLSCFCFPYTGTCAMYYAWRANHGVDFDIDQGLVQRHTTKAKVLTTVSIVLGIVLIVIWVIILVWVLTSTGGGGDSEQTFASDSEQTVANYYGNYGRGHAPA